MRRLALALILCLPLVGQTVKQSIGSGGGGGAPTTAQYWLGAADGTLSAEIVVNDIATLETAIGGYDFSDASNLNTGTIPEARIGAFSSLVNINGGFEVADFRCTAAAGELTCEDPTAATGDTKFIVKSGAGQTGNLQEWQNSIGTALVNVALSGQVNSVWGFKTTSAYALTTTGFELGTGVPILFSSTTSYASSKDLGLARSAAGVLKVTDGSTGYGQVAAASLALGATGATFYGASASEPVSCSSAIHGSLYFDTEDQVLCVCANDGVDDEWLTSDNYSHGSGHCSL